jgi:hypothetical protein
VVRRKLELSSNVSTPETLGFICILCASCLYSFALEVQCFAWQEAMSLEDCIRSDMPNPHEGTHCVGTKLAGQSIQNRVIFSGLICVEIYSEASFYQLHKFR